MFITTIIIAKDGSYPQSYKTYIAQFVRVIISTSPLLDFEVCVTRAPEFNKPRDLQHEDSMLLVVVKVGRTIKNAESLVTNWMPSKASHFCGGIDVHRRLSQKQKMGVTHSIDRRG